MMIRSFITRGLLLVFAYAYPAYECYKTVEMNGPDVNELRFWCQYWILVAGFTVLERIGDTFISWVPMYGEAKVAFLVYLWFPKTKGTTYLYDSFVKRYLARHEVEINRTLLELRTRVGDSIIVTWQKAAAYGQTRVFDILQYIASQSSDAQTRNPGMRSQRPAVSENNKLEILSPSSDHQEGTTEQQKIDSKPEVSQHRATPTPSISEINKTSARSNDEQAMQINSESPIVVENPRSPLITQEEAAKPRQRRVNSGR